MTITLNQNNISSKLLSVLLWTIIVAIPLIAWKSEEIGLNNEVKIGLYAFYPALISFMSNSYIFSKVNSYFILFSCLTLFLSQFIIVSQTNLKDKVNENSVWIIFSFLIAFITSLTILAFFGNALDLDFYSDKRMINYANKK